MDKDYKSVQEQSEKYGVYEDSESVTDRVPAQNEYEKSKWNSNGYNQSGTKVK